MGGILKILFLAIIVFYHLFARAVMVMMCLFVVKRPGMSYVIP